MSRSKAQLAKEKRDAATSKKMASPNPFDCDGKAFDGKDKDNPSDIDNDDVQERNKSGQLESGFKRILKTAFRIKGDAKHEVFEALLFAEIYTWDLFIETELRLIRKLTTATKNNRVPIMHRTKARLKSLLGLYLHTVQHHTDADAEDPFSYTELMIKDYLKQENIKQIQNSIAKDDASASMISARTSPIAPKEIMFQALAIKQRHAEFAKERRCREIEAEADRIKQRHLKIINPKRFFAMRKRPNDVPKLIEKQQYDLPRNDAVVKSKPKLTSSSNDMLKIINPKQFFAMR